MTDLPVAKLLEGVALWDFKGDPDEQPAVREFAKATWHRLNVRDLAYNAIRGMAHDVVPLAEARIAKFNKLKAEHLDHNEEDVSHAASGH